MGANIINHKGEYIGYGHECKMSEDELKNRGKATPGLWMLVEDADTLIATRKANQKKKALAIQEAMEKAEIEARLEAEARKKADKARIEAQQKLAQEALAQLGKPQKKESETIDAEDKKPEEDKNPEEDKKPEEDTSKVSPRRSK